MHMNTNEMFLCVSWKENMNEFARSCLQKEVTVLEFENGFTCVCSPAIVSEY